MRLGSGRNRCKTNATDDIHHFFSARFLICGALHLNQKCLFSKMICKTLDQPMAYVHKNTTYIYLFGRLWAKEPRHLSRKKLNAVLPLSQGASQLVLVVRVQNFIPFTTLATVLPFRLVKIFPTVLPGRGPAFVANSNPKVGQGLAVVPATAASRSKSPTS